MSWEVGDFGTPLVSYYQSNLMPIHVSGNTGVNQHTLTVVSTNDPTGQNVTQITLYSGAAASDANAVFAGDLFQFPRWCIRSTEHALFNIYWSCYFVLTQCNLEQLQMLLLIRRCCDD